jgi:hypothetical protein
MEISTGIIDYPLKSKMKIKDGRLRTSGRNG